MNKIIIIEDKNYLEIFNLNNKKLILIEFWANWCSPCMSMAEEIEEISKLHINKITILKAEIEKNNILIEKFKIKSIPTVIIIKKNKILEKISGVINKKELEKLIENLL